MKRKSWLAALLNLLWSPFGYFYTGHKQRFYFFLFLSPALVILALAIIPHVSSHATTGVMVVLASIMGLLYLGMAVDAWRCAAAPENTPLFRKPAARYSLPALLGLSLVLEFGLIPVLRPVIADPRNIPSASMMPNLLPGDYVFVARLRGEPARGDMIAFYPPGEDEKLFIKRLVGLPGDQIDLWQETLTVNGTAANVLRIRINDTLLPLIYKGVFAPGCAMSECFVFVEGEGAAAHEVLEAAHAQAFAADSFVLQPDEYFMLGDNRDDSQDSRFIGPIPRGELRARYVYTFASFAPPKCDQFEATIRLECRAAQSESVSIPDTVVRLLNSTPRWSRFGTVSH